MKFNSIYLIFLNNIYCFNIQNINNTIYNIICTIMYILYIMCKCKKATIIIIYEFENVTELQIL